MKTFLAAAVLALTLSPAAFARTNPQHAKMKQCNTEAKAQSLHGTARKSFMSHCLSNGGKVKATPATRAATKRKLNAQQLKMQSCNVRASQVHLKGKARKSFMSSCLKK